MNRVAFLALVLATLLSTVCCSEDESTPISIQFVGEDGKPIPDALFYLFEYQTGSFQKAIYRHHKLPASARIELATIPKEFLIGVVSSEHFYHWFAWSQDFSIATGENIIKVQQTGTVSLDFSRSARWIRPLVLQQATMVVPYSRELKTGEYEHVGGSGVGYHSDLSCDIEGLQPGKYRFELKDDYNTAQVYWSQEDVVVEKGRVTKLEGLSARKHQSVFELLKEKDCTLSDKIEIVLMVGMPIWIGFVFIATWLGMIVIRRKTINLRLLLGWTAIIAAALAILGPWHDLLGI